MVSISIENSKKSQIDSSSLKPSVSNMPNMGTSNSGSSEAAVQSSTSITSTQDHLQPPTSVSLSSNSSLNSSSVKSTTSKPNDGTTTDKKRKSMSSSRQKKFHRRFKQVAMDEELINCMYLLIFHISINVMWLHDNYTTQLKKKTILFIIADFSCAFVSDILLQGYMYITKNHIAFYSNVFGYVTKLLIPVTSVARISKEKTVKIFPNAIAVATADERHVFSSFLSREAAYQLMISVWKEALPMSDIDVTTSAAQLRVCTAVPPEKCKTENSTESKLNADSAVPEKIPTSTTCTLQVVNQRRRNSASGISEIDDESSSAISGNEGLVKLLQSKNALLNGEAISNDQSNANNSSSSCCNSNPSANNLQSSDVNISNSFTPTTKTNGFGFNGNSTISIFKLKIPRTIHIAYFGLSLVIILALMAGFLFYRISEIKSTRQMGAFSINELKVDDLNYLIFYVKFELQQFTEFFYVFFI